MASDEKTNFKTNNFLKDFKMCIYNILNLFLF